MNLSAEFEATWRAAEAAYVDGAVNSERTLHSLLYAELRTRVPEALVLCEPRINVQRHGCFVPDIVVIVDHSVVAIAELKFVPHSYPVYELDLRKLAVLAEYREPFPLRLEPSSGEFSSARFSVDQSCLLVFGAIGKHDAAAVDKVGLSAAMGPLAPRFLPLVRGVGR